MIHEHKDCWIECWQNNFIQSNLPVIGYFAWRGFMNVGRGLTVCTVDTQVLSLQSNSLITVPFKTQFVSVSTTIEYLEKTGIEKVTARSIQSVIQSYTSQSELVLLLSVDRQLEIVLLQNLAITPVECYQQVSQRWQEFMIIESSNDPFYL